MEDFEVRPMLLNVCYLCREGAGGECHVTGCSFWMNRAPDIPLTSLLPREGLIHVGSEALVGGHDNALVRRLQELRDRFDGGRRDRGSMRRIYIVIAESGSYDDYYQWMVRAFEDEEQAKDHAERAGREARLAAFIARSLGAGSWREPCMLVEYDGDDGISLHSEYDPDPLFGDWEEKHRFQEAATSSYGPIYYRVQEVDLT